MKAWFYLYSLLNKTPIYSKMLMPHTLKAIQDKFLILTIGLLTILACSHMESALQCMKVPGEALKQGDKGGVNQPTSEQDFDGCLDFKQFPRHVFGCHVLPFLRGGDIHNFILTANSLRLALWEELPFFFKGEERTEQLGRYLSRPECLIPLATMYLRQYMRMHYSSKIDAGKVFLPAPPVLSTKAKMVDLLAVRSNLCIDFLHSLSRFLICTSHENSRPAFMFAGYSSLSNPLEYHAACLLISMCDYLSFPAVLDTLHIPRDRRIHNATQRAIYDDFAVLNNPHADSDGRKLSQKLSTHILAIGGGWIAKFDLPQVVASKGNIFLHYEARCGRTNLAKHLLRRGFNVNSVDSSEKTPLHYAAKNGHLEIAELLLASCARVNQADLHGRTPLIYAARYGHLALVKIFLAYGADINHAEQWGKTSLHYASRFNHPGIARLLLENGADIHQKDEKGHSALHMTVQSNALNIAKLLVEKGASLNAKNYSGFTPLHQATQHRRRKRMMRLLLAKNADINARDNRGNTPLIHAIYPKANLEATKLLIAHGADVNVRCRENVRRLANNTLLQQVECTLSATKLVIWHDIMGHTPYDNERSKYLHFLASMAQIEPSFRLAGNGVKYFFRYLVLLRKDLCSKRLFPPHDNSTSSSPLTISPQDTFFVLSQCSHAHIRQVFGDNVLDEVNWVLLYQDVMTMLEKAMKTQKQLTSDQK